MRRSGGMGWLCAVAVALILFAGPGPASLWPSGMAMAQDDDGGDDGDDDGGSPAGGEARSEDRSDDRPAARAPARGPLRVLRPSGNNRQPGRPSGGRSARAATPEPAAVPRPEFAPGEIVVTDLTEADLTILQGQGFTVIERVDLAQVAVVLHRLQVPPTLTLDEARARVRAQPSGATGDFNHYYRSSQDSPPPLPAPSTPPAPTPTALTAPAPPAPPSPLAAQPDATLLPATLLPAALPPSALPPAAPCDHLNCASLALIRWPAARVAVPTCQVTVPVGMIDTGVNADHDAMIGADVEVVRLSGEAVDPSSAVHGTAVAALLVGQKADRAPGLIPEAPLIAVDVFGRAAGDERASVVALVQGLDLLATRKARVINLSLSGPPNATLEQALAQITGTNAGTNSGPNSGPSGAVVLAAAGNGGPAAGVAFPAGYPFVVAVTAVDPRGQVYRRAQRGPHLDLAAPGVEVWSATSVSGVKPKTGTSFAVPFATAVAAVLVSQDPAAPPALIADRLRALTRDTGAAGPDEVFGAGILSLDGLCAP